jgi:hypothetical protein
MNNAQKWPVDCRLSEGNHKPLRRFGGLFT